MRNKMLIIVLSVLMMSCGIKKEVAEQSRPDVRIEKLKADIQEKFDSTDFVGLGLAIIKKNGIAFSGGFGNTDSQQNKKYTHKTIQPIGSISKTFIATAIAKAIDLGYFTLETEINEILPFELRNPRHPEANISVWNLVTHTSGITDSDLFWSHCYYIADTTNVDAGTAHIKEFHDATQGKVPTLKELITHHFKKEGKWYGQDNFIDAIPGDTYEYSNIGSSLAAYLIEVKSGIPFDEFCNIYIFKPLGLNNTQWQQPKHEELNATLYLDKNTPLPIFQLSSYPDGGLHTTAEDLSLFLLEMMKGYEGQSEFLRQETFTLLFEKKFADKEKPKAYPKNTNSGIFWDWMRNGMIGHNGADPGLFTMFSFHPEEKVGYVIMLNRDIMANDNKRELFLQLKTIMSVLRAFSKE